MTAIDCGDNTNLFQPTGFRVIIDRRFYGTFQFFVAKVDHPGAQNPAAEAPFERVAQVPFPGSSMSFGELSMEVLLDEDFRTYKEIYNWMLRHVNEDQIAERNGFTSSQSPIPSYADIHITALTHANNKNVEFRYKDCIPTSLGNIPFDAQNQSVEFVTFPVSFRFSYFEIV
jgi:hypothetical protein